MTNAAYNKVVDELKEVASGRRGWVSLTRAEKECGISKMHLRVVALALNLDVEVSHGNHGMTATRKPKIFDACEFCREDVSACDCDGR